MTKLSGALPKGSENGLAEHIAAFVNNPHKQHVVIAIVKTDKLTTDVDEGDVVPTLKILRVERIRPEDADIAHQIFRAALDERSGQHGLPLETEDARVIEVIFRDQSDEANQ